MSEITRTFPLGYVNGKERHHRAFLHGVETVQKFIARSKERLVNRKERQHSSLLQGVKLSNSSQLGIKKGYRGDNTALF